MSLEVDVSGAQQKFKQAGVKVHQAMPKLLKRLAGQGERHMKQNIPVKTGNLRNSTVSWTNTNDATIWNSASYAKYVNDGTRPHIIRPRYAKALCFAPFGARMGVRGGAQTGLFKFGGKTVNVGVVFANEVHHPGTKGVHFMEKTRDHIIKIIPVEADRIIQQALQ